MFVNLSDVIRSARVRNMFIMKPNSRIRNWGVAICLLAFIAAVSSAPDKRICTTVDPDCEGNILDCSRSILCHHGDCDGRGACLCQPCWRGEHCNEYVDAYSPTFLVKSKYVALSAFDSGVLFVAEAIDEDAAMTCHYDDVICPCASVRYSIQSGNEYDLFTINSQSGQVYVTTGAHLTTGVEYVLVIRASSLLTHFNDTSLGRRTHDDMQVTVRVDEIVRSNNTQPMVANARIVEDDNIADGNNVDRKESYDSETLAEGVHDNHVRRKRTADGEKPADTIMVLTLVESTALDKVNLWSKASYKLEILLPKITEMDLLVELFTNDPETKNSTFRICSARVNNVGSSVTSDIGLLKDVQPEMKMNADGMFEDRAIFNFSKVSNTEATDNASRVIEIVFLAVLIKSPAFQDKAKYYITAGAEYDSESFVWVGQSEMEAAAVEDSPGYDSNFELTGPESIAEDQSGVYTIVAGITHPMENLTLDIFSPDDTYIDLFSVGNIRVKDAGENFACLPKDKLAFPMTFYSSETEKSKYRGTLNVQDVLNCGTDRTNANDTKHKLTLEFAIYVLKGTLDIVTKDGHLMFATGLLIGQKTIWTAITNITVGQYNPDAEKKGTGPKVKLVNPMTDFTMPEKGVTLIRYELGFDDTSYTKTKLKITIPADTGEMSLCSVQLFYRGFNIPFVPKLVYVFKDGSTPNTSVEATVDFGRIQTTGQIPNNETANSLVIDIGLRSVKAFKDQKITLVTDGAGVDSPKISTEVANVSSDVTLTFNDLLSTDTLYDNGETGVDMEFTFPVGSPYDPFVLEVMGQFGNDAAAARICRVEVTSVGRLMPCVNKTQLNENTEYTYTMDAVEWDDRAVVPFERLCVARSAAENQTESDTKMTVNFVAELPKQPALKPGNPYWLNAGIKMGTEHVLAGSIKYDVKAADKGDFSDGFEPIFEGYPQDGLGPLEKGSKYAFFRFKLPPRSRANYKLTMELSDPGASICGLKLLHIGHNMPCVYRKLFPGNTDLAGTTTITYTPTAPTSTTYYTKAELDFGSLANVGVDPLITSRRNDRNSILVGAGIHVTDRNKPYDITWKFEYGKIAPKSDKITLVMGNLPTAGTFENVSMSTVDGTNKIYDGVTTIVYVDFQFPNYVTAETVDVTFSKKAGDKALDFCSASVTYVGANMPCLDVDRVTVENSGDEKMIANLGKVCHTNAFEDSEASRIRVEMAFNSPDGAGATIQADVNIAGKTKTAEVVLTTATGPPPKARHRPFSEAHVSFPSVPDLTIPVSKKSWIPVKLSIPTNATLKFNATVEGAYDSNRAILTLYGVMIGEAGINVACMRNGSFLVPEFSKSADVTTYSQNNVMKVDFGYLTNTGFTDKRGTFRKPDNEVTVLFLVRMTDHPNVEDKAVFPLTITIQGDDVVVTKVQNLTATRVGNEVEKINITATIPDKKDSYNKDDSITVNILITHEEDSSLEPTTFYVRILGPPFLGYGSHTANQTNIKQSSTPYVQLEIDALLFEDSISIELKIKVDPENKRKPGSPATTASPIVRGVCNVTARTGFKYPPKFHYCTSQVVLSVAIGSSGGCEGDLTPSIQDCQLTASSGMDENTMPKFGRTKQEKFWSPAYRLGKLEQFYQVDFGNVTMVMYVKIKKIANAAYQPITSFGLRKSNNGRVWNAVKGPLTYGPLTYGPDDFHTENLNGTLQTRFLRIDVVLPKYVAKTDPPIAAQFELHGCAISGSVKSEDVCSDAATTRNSNDFTNYRHFTVDLKRNAMYLCDYIHTNVRVAMPTLYLGMSVKWRIDFAGSNLGYTISMKLHKMNCFCSETEGKTWAGLPSSIGYLIGYDKTAQSVYAVDKKGRNFMKSVTCKKWTPLKDKSVVTGSSVEPAKVVAAKPAKSLEEVKVNDWKVNFDGVSFKDKLRINWSVCSK